MNKYNVKVSKLEDGSYKLKINNADYYGLDEFEALAIKYLQEQLQQKDHIIEELEHKLEAFEKTYDNAIKNSLADHKYSSEMEGKYIQEHYIVEELEKWLLDEISQGHHTTHWSVREKLKELKEKNND